MYRIDKFLEVYPQSPFNVIYVNGKPHITTPLTLLSQNVSAKIAYLGSKNRFVRGIPVREWRLCGYTESDHVSHRITISYSG